MTRINVIPPEELLDLHVLAEYRELPRVFTLAAAAHKRMGFNWKAKQPAAYTFGPGHVMFFYDKLKWAAERQDLLVRDLQRRGYVLNFTDNLHDRWRSMLPAEYWQDYTPTDEALALNWERVYERMRGKTWWLRDLPFFI